MKYRQLGNTDMNASIVGLGTWVMGGGSIWGKEPDDNESIRVVHASLDEGINLVDTAPLYGFGRSEEVVGKAIKGRRDEVILATKCGLWWHDERGSLLGPFDGEKVFKSLRPDTIEIEIEDSLKRLGTDRIDLYQTHWPAVEPEKTPIEDTMACLNKLKDQGKIRAIGVSNVSVDELKENMQHGEIVSDQFRYSMLYREPEENILPFCAENNVSTLTYMSLEQGLLTGKVGMDRDFGEDEWRSNEDWNPWFKKVNRPKILDMLAGWKGLTEKYSCTLAQLVVAWTAQQRGVTHVLCGARRVDQTLDNAKAGGLELAESDIAKIRSDVEGLGEPQ
ncbi:General stress protein 69 [Anaerohalosphaera lusitana]|uniref:General stress protein 69 n=1 Tax=Anaerohalosphaera lusitana TaxID=1936003 RepID=A0A1U9NQV4_9BACT|nr:aldo/keto reductase [Anaerohalosphaera lusitana]AQT70312.1 General stress protein 69 [Anaerohalosphaera lusitana]